MVWDPFDLPRQDGKTIVVTGANRGIGYFAAEQLAGAGARVILACRDSTRADAAARSIRARVPGAAVALLELDVSNLTSVRAASDWLRGQNGIDVLIENAGIVHPPRRRETSVDGNELVLSTNFLGHFALTALVMPALRQVPHGRIVLLGSMASRLSGFDVDDLELEHGYMPWKAYAQSKIAVQSFGFELGRRLRSTAASMSATVAHPGYSISGLTEDIRLVNEPTRRARFAGNLQALAAQSKNRGAWSIVRAAIDRDAAGGSYWGPSLITRGRPTQQQATRTSLDPVVARRLWHFAEEATGVPFPL